MGLFDKLKSSIEESMSVPGLDKFSKFTGTNKRSSLETPPPPAVPAPHETMSVMVAVNGQTYGPYERATLLNMIADGSLTPQTYVFINGMVNWQPAQAVPQVAALFHLGAPAPAAPPVPWSTNGTTASAANDGPFSAKLNNLITAAIADGEISDLERQVLIRNAQEEGVSMDEFVMVLEARLYEQRQTLLARQKQQAAVQTPPMQPVAPQVAQPTNKMNKCPACGAPIKIAATQCPECGYEYNANTHENNSAWERLNHMLNEVDNQKSQGLMGGYLSLMGMGDRTPDKINKKKAIITNFPIPSDKKSIMDFFISCATIAKEGGFVNRNELAGAYKTKAKQVLIKARVIMKDDPEMLGELNEIAKQYKIKA